MEGAAQGSAAQEHGARYLELWNWDGTLERVHHALYVAVSEQAGREARQQRSSMRRAQSNALLMADMPEIRCARRLRSYGGCASSSVSMLPASRSCPNAGIGERTFCVDQPQTRDFERYTTTVIAFVRFAAQAARCKHLGMNLNFPDGPLDTHSNM
jgi:hypothetical protein